MVIELRYDEEYNLALHELEKQGYTCKDGELPTSGLIGKCLIKTEDDGRKPFLYLIIIGKTILLTTQKINIGKVYSFKEAMEHLNSEYANFSYKYLRDVLISKNVSETDFIAGCAHSYLCKHGGSIENAINKAICYYEDNVI